MKADVFSTFTADYERRLSSLSHIDTISYCNAKYQCFACSKTDSFSTNSCKNI